MNKRLWIFSVLGFVVGLVLIGIAASIPV